MKTLKTVLSITLLFIVGVTSCTFAQKSQRTEKDYPIKSFTWVKSNIMGNIVYTQSDHVKVHAKGDEELVDKLKVTEKEGELHLFYEDKVKSLGAKKITVYISSPIIEKIVMNGVGNFKMEDAVAVDSLTIDFEGVGNFEAMELESNSIQAAYQGVGSLKLAGTTDLLDVTVEGVGNVDTKELLANNTVIRADGVGSVKCFASKRIDLKNKGLGSITYYGNPEIKNMKNTGIGKIKAGE